MGQDGTEQTGRDRTERNRRDGRRDGRRPENLRRRYSSAPCSTESTLGVIIAPKVGVITVPKCCPVQSKSWEADGWMDGWTEDVEHSSEKKFSIQCTECPIPQSLGGTRCMIRNWRDKVHPVSSSSFTLHGGE
ncbi:hypothetical protein TURU_044873 [Turdus rufiventris]|nr:hypothetical protein TURU_044873 [Turdus rufiventris]